MINIYIDLMETCMKQQRAKYSFSYQTHLMFEDKHKEVDIPIGVHADCVSINQHQDNPKVFLINFQLLLVVIHYHHLEINFTFILE